VGAPVVYIGPNPSHVTEILDRPGVTWPSIRVAHGEADILANQIQDFREKLATTSRPLPPAFAADYSKGVLLPNLIATLEGL
jgi:hypothetical protein